MAALTADQMTQAIQDLQLRVQALERATPTRTPIQLIGMVGTVLHILSPTSTPPIDQWPREVYDKVQAEVARILAL